MWSFGAMIALLLTLIVVTSLFGRDYPGRDYVRLGSYDLLTIMLWRQVALLVRTQIRRRRKDRLR